MNRDDIANMWEKANGWSIEGWPKTIDEIERFAKLVAAAERKALRETVDELMGAERDRNTMFSDGYDYGLWHVQKFIEGRERGSP
ncbi:MAG: hypothetical protein EBZ61_08165 [Micrococcales bacterium]|nr:hypothetical protein [Micrococcales bacterium]